MTRPSKSNPFFFLCLCPQAADEIGLLQLFMRFANRRVGRGKELADGQIVGSDLYPMNYVRFDFESWMVEPCERDWATPVIASHAMGERCNKAKHFTLAMVEHLCLD